MLRNNLIIAWRNLMRQFIGEAVVLSVVGLGAGCALHSNLAALLLPAFNATFSQELSLGLSEPSMLGALVVLLLLVGLGAGWYPALVLSRLVPLSAIRRSVSMTGIARLSRVLISAQLAISVGLITCTVVMYHQLEHLMTRHVDQEGIILVDTDPVRSRHVNPLVEAFLRHGRIASISLLDEEYDDFLEKDSGKYRAVTKSNREAKVRPYEVDHNFVETMNLELIHGRDFSLDQGDKDNLVVISESAAARLGFADPIDETIDIVRMSSREGRKPIGGRSGIGTGARIIGVVKDFTFESGYEDVLPGLLLLSPDYSADLIFVRVKPGDLQEVVQYMEKTWRQHRRLCGFPLLLPAAGYGSGLSRRTALASADHVGCGRRDIRLCLGCLCAHCPRRGSPHQGDRHPQSPRCQRLWSHHADDPRVCLSRADWLGGGVASVVVVDARLAKWLCLPH